MASTKAERLGKVTGPKDPSARFMDKSVSDPSLRRRSSVSSIMDAVSTLEALNKDVRQLPGLPKTGSFLGSGAAKKGGKNNARRARRTSGAAFRNHDEQEEDSFDSRATVPVGRSKPGQLGALPDHLKAKRERVKSMADLKSARRASVMLNKSALEDLALNKTLASIAKKESRITSRIERAKREPAQMTWLTVIAMCNGASAIWEPSKVAIEKYRGEKEQHEAAKVIQKRLMTAKRANQEAAFKKVETTFRMFQAKARFKNKCRSRVRAGIQVRSFIIDYSKGSYFRFILQAFRWQVIKGQRYIRAFNAGTQARRRALALRFDRACTESAAEIRSGALETLASQLTFEQLAVLEGRREQEHLDAKWKKTNSKFDALFADDMTTSMLKVQKKREKELQQGQMVLPHIKEEIVVKILRDLRRGFRQRHHNPGLSAKRQGMMQPVKVDISDMRAIMRGEKDIEVEEGAVLQENEMDWCYRKLDRTVLLTHIQQGLQRTLQEILDMLSQDNADMEKYKHYNPLLIKAAKLAAPEDPDDDKKRKG